MNDPIYDINSIKNITTFHKVIKESISEEGDKYDSNNIKVLYNEIGSGYHTVWMYYRNKYEFIIKCNLDGTGKWIVTAKQSKDLMSSYLKRFCFKVMTEKLKYDEKDNIYENESFGKFIYNKKYLKKYNKTIVFKYIEGLELGLNVFKHIYAILCPNILDNQSLKFYDSSDKYSIDIPIADQNFDLETKYNKNNFIHYVAENDNRPISVFRLKLHTKHDNLKLEFYKNAILNYNKDFWVYTLWYLESEYDYVDISLENFEIHEKYIIREIEKYGDTFDKSKLIDVYQMENNDGDEVRWMYYKNTKEFIIECNISNNQFNCCHVDTVKLTGNENNNIYGNTNPDTFMLNTMCIRKTNKNIIFKIVKEICLPLNVLKLYYPLLMTGKDDCVLKHYNSGLDLKEHIYDCICCTKTNTKFIKFNSLDADLTYFVTMNNNDPLVVFQTDNTDNNDIICYKSSYILGDNSDSGSCFICYTE